VQNDGNFIGVLNDVIVGDDMAILIDDKPGINVARKYGYTYAAFNSLKQKFKAGKLDFFSAPKRGPKGPRLSTETRKLIVNYRRKNLSAYQIAEVLETVNDEKVSISTIDRVLDQEGFPKLARRTQLKIGITKDNTIVPEYAETIHPSSLDGLEVNTDVGGIFLFAPFIEHFKIPQAIQKAKLPRSPKISALSYVMSMLSLKLVGKERLSQINDFNFDAGLGLMSQLNYLPKSTAISTYSYRLASRDIRRLMTEYVRQQIKAGTYGNSAINLDFKTIQQQCPERAYLLFYRKQHIMEKEIASAQRNSTDLALLLIEPGPLNLLIGLFSGHKGLLYLRTTSI